MHGYELGPFKNGKAFIHFDGVIDGKSDYGPRICINNKGEKLFELPDRDMFVWDYEDEDIAFVTDKNGLQAVMDNRGNFLTDFAYNRILGGSEEGLWEVKRNGKHGHIDITGKELIPCMYDDGGYFSEGVVAECLNGKCGMVDTRNEIIIPFEYEGICVCKNFLINAKKNGKYGLINKRNEVVVDFLYDEIDCWCTRDCTAYPTLKDDKWGIIDRYGNVLEDFIYDDAQLISDNEDNAGEFIILLKGDFKAIYSTKKRGFITEFEYNFIGYLSNNRFLVLKNGKVGFVDTYGEVVIPLIYDKYTHDDFSEGLCVVYKDGKAGMIDTEGNVVVPFEYYKLYNCHEGMIWARNEKYENGYLNRKGEIVIPFGKYHVNYRFSDGLTSAWSENTGNVYLTKQGEVIELKF